jgi:hypothetical protein
MFVTRLVKYDKSGQIYDNTTGELIPTKNRLCVCTFGHAFVELHLCGKDYWIGKVVKTMIR